MDEQNPLPAVPPARACPRADRPTARPVGVRTLVKAWAGLVATLAGLAAILFLLAGRLDWPMAWVFLALFTILVAGNIVVLVRVNPAVIEGRLRGGRGVKRWDLALMPVMAVLTVGTVVVAALDQRFAWSPAMPLWLQVAAAPVITAGDLLFLWAMATNRFFSKVVRIEVERGHRVVIGGPYAYVRHPGYVGWGVMWAALPLLLGSLLAYIPAGLSIALIVVRTALEDRALRAELDGYKAYARHVRYRLLPGIW